MINFEGLKYISTNLSNLSGIPVRIYKNDKEFFYHSLVNLIKDPFILDKVNVLKINDNVSYYQNSYYYYYGIINYKKYKIILGPTRQIPISDQELRSICFLMNINPSLNDEFISQLKTIVSLPLMTLIQILCMVYFALSGEKKSIENIIIHESKQEIIKDEIEKENINKLINNLENNSVGPYNAFDTENKLLDMVMRGDVSAVNQFISNVPSIRSGTIAQEQLRQVKNIFIVTATLVSRAAIRGGMDITSALYLSDQYIQKCELAPSLDLIDELHYRMVIDYTEKVEKLKLGKNSSILVNKVSNYVQNNLSKPIKVNEIAKTLFIGRSRLSTNFKNETGINISDYIIKLKIDEAKRLLRYSNNTFATIASFLGFSSQSHFTKVFKKYTNSTPFDYRQTHKHY